MQRYDEHLKSLADSLILGVLMERLHHAYGGFELKAHWTQGEFHHDLVFKVEHKGLPRFLVVSTNCNGGIKDVLGFDEEPGRWALWHHRCPDNPEFEGELPDIVASVQTPHWFHPCELLVENARSELKESHRKRQRGGGWEKL